MKQKDAHSGDYVLGIKKKKKSVRDVCASSVNVVHPLTGWVFFFF